MSGRVLAWVEVIASIIVLALIVAGLDWLFNAHTPFAEAVAILALYEATRAKRAANKDCQS